MPRVSRTLESEQDYASIWDYIAPHNPPAADRLLKRFDATLERLAEFPSLGRVRDELAPGLRSYVVGRYVLFYREARNGIELIRVLPGERDLHRHLRRRSPK